MPDWLIAIVLGVVEGLTEFIPVSSTGHLILAKTALGLDQSWDTFLVLIQLGAILAVVLLYFQRLWRVVGSFPSHPAGGGLQLHVIPAFLPAGPLGVSLRQYIR